MTRRKGVIAALAGVAGAFSVKAQTVHQGTLTLNLQNGPVSAGACRAVPTTIPPVFTCKQEYMEEPQYALIVTYGEKTVKLTAQEIMEALESK